MPDGREPPGLDVAPWLAAFRRACDRAAEAIAAIDPAQRAQRLGPGAGGDITMRVDRVAEDIVVEELEALGRPLTLISEEVGERAIGGGGRHFVVVDPVDGSVNAARGLPAFATSIALADGPSLGDVVLGVVRDHGTGEEHMAIRGEGAWRDGRPIRAAEPRDDGRLPILMVEGATPRRLTRAAGRLEGRVGRFRAVGALALSLCHAASGRADAAVGLGQGRSVDIAAAQLVAREAGLLVGLPYEDDLEAGALALDARYHVVAAPSAAVMALLRDAALGRGDDAA
ncbi:MAG: inositol monophosphatase family protein [Thermoleophilia bacterium]